MEALLAGKTRSVAIGVLRALVVPLRENWGDLQGFREAGLDVLAREGAGILYDDVQSPEHLDQVYRQVLRARARHFRSIENPAQLEHLYRELDFAAAEAATPLQQGVLWLASRIQLAAVSFVQSPAGQAHLTAVLRAIDDHRTALTRSLADSEHLTLERIEATLSTLSRDILTVTVGRFELYALAGHMLEIARAAARKSPVVGMAAQEAPENQDVTPLLAVLVEPVQIAELNEARLRYARLSEEERSRRYNEFRRQLLPIISEVAPFAPYGFEEFCQAIEAAMLPYPQRLEFIRSYARPLYTNGSQSKLFDEASTPKSVEQRYEAFVRSKQGNPAVLEIAKAFALRSFKHSDQESKRAFMQEVDLHAEFNWPTTLAELKAAMRSPSS